VIEDKFPFKWMQKIVDTFSISNKPQTALQIARNIGSCSSDAKEVAKMLVFLTQYGQIVTNGEKWKIQNIADNQDHHPTGFRAHFIKDLLVILEYLTENPASPADLALNAKKSESDIINQLNFLSSLTKSGYLYLHKKNFLQQWGFRSWKE